MTIKPTCKIPQQPDYTNVTILELSPDPILDDYLQAMNIANNEAKRSIGEFMLLACTTEIVILSRLNMPVNAM